MIVLILKIFLSLLSIAFGFTSYFIIKEYKKFRKSHDAEDGSLIEKFMIGTMAFSSVILMSSMLAFCVLLIFSSISIILPL